MDCELTGRLVTKASPNRAFVINYWWRLSSRDFFIKSRSFRYFCFIDSFLFCVNHLTRVYVFGLISFCFPFGLQLRRFTCHYIFFPRCARSLKSRRIYNQSSKFLGQAFHLHMFFSAVHAIPIGILIATLGRNRCRKMLPRAFFRVLNYSRSVAFVVEKIQFAFRDQHFVNK